jgi:ribonuclease-3
MTGGDPSCQSYSNEIINIPHPVKVIMDERRKKKILDLLRDPVFGIQTTNEEALSLYDQALTHSSYEKPDNERLEFFGDCILDFCIATELYTSFERRADTLRREFPKMKDEALLTEMLHSITNDLDLSEKASTIKLFDDAIQCGLGQALNESIRAGAFEAFIGAMLIDQGQEKTLDVIAKLFVEEIRNAKPIASWKNKLQECVQAQNKTAMVQGIIKYQTCREEGTPDHDARHMSTVQIKDSGKDWVIWGEGHGKKAKDAEVAAAKIAFEKYCRKEE